MYRLPSSLLAGLILPVALLAAPAQAATTTQTIVLVRNAEKPATGLGQLSCQGLNRALALPDVLVGKYGAPTALFAPDTDKVSENSSSYYYVRPLMTLEPTAIGQTKPLNTPYGFTEIADMQTVLLGSSYQSATLFVAWNDDYLVDLARGIVTASGGDSTIVPDWTSGDYDSIYVLRITNADGTKSVTFSKDLQGLNTLSTACR